MALVKSPCAGITRKHPDLEVTEEIVKSIGRNYRVAPIFEKGLHEYVYKNHYSLQRNELLKCGWREYKEKLANMEFKPFQFVDVRDYHFYLCKNRYYPNETIHKKGDFRKKLNPGPGVDFKGQKPIPEELKMKRL